MKPTTRYTEVVSVTEVLARWATIFAEHSRARLRVRAVCEQSQRDAVADYWKHPTFWDAVVWATLQQIGKRVIPAVYAMVAEGTR